MYLCICTIYYSKDKGSRLAAGSRVNPFGELFWQIESWGLYHPLLIEWCVLHQRVSGRIIDDVHITDTFRLKK